MPPSSPLRHGPDLPYSLIAAVIPSTHGWLVASARLNGSIFALEDPRVLDSFAEVLNERPSFSVIALDAPVGEPDKAARYDRTCDREARALLERVAQAGHGAPCVPALAAERQGEHERPAETSSQFRARYEEVATAMSPFRQRTVFEVRPEMSFYQLNGDAPLGEEGEVDEARRARRALLEARIPAVDQILDATLEGVSPSDLLDAAACLWTARRIAARIATRLPGVPEWDDLGLRTEIVR